MRLLRLSANKKGFHTVSFNRSGISLIIGKKENPAVKDEKKTYNGLGKSLIIQLIHFCLASNPIEEFGKKLTDWEFSLEFEIGKEAFISKRNTKDMREILLNGKNMPLDKFRSELGGRLFDLKTPVKWLTFRSLISRFIRPRKSSYLEYCDFVNKEEEYSRQLNNAYLLGLDVEKITKKHVLKEQHDKTDKLRKNIEEDEIFKSYFHEEGDVDIDIVDLEEQIARIENRLKNYMVAEDYEKIRKEADDCSARLRVLKNQSTALKNAIRNIEKSLTVQPDIPKDTVFKLYGEARLTLSDMVVKRVEEVEEFHNKLLSNRTKRLIEEKKELALRLKDMESEKIAMGKREDELLQYLNTHGALEEFTALNNQLANMKTKLNKLKTYKEILQEYKNKLAEIKIEFEKENIETNNYLIQIKLFTDMNVALFRSFSREFYDNKPGGIEISNNDGMNKMRFNINAKIQDDASDGIGEVKIFCFDWMLLKAKHNHKVNFLFHDSRLLANMDPRQRAILFKQAHKHAVGDGLQYIISANEDMLESIKGYFEPNEYQEVIEKNKILELTDKSDETRLLGIQVDMDYEGE